MALFSNTLQVVRHYLAATVGDLIYGQAGTTDATTTKIYAPFLWQANDYYKNHFYEAYVYAGTNIGVTKRVIGWVLTSKLLEIHSVYSAACDATSFVELHRIFTEDEYRKAINLAIESLAGKYLIDIKDESTITLSADTYEYALPLSMLYIDRIITEQTAAGGVFREQDVIDPRDYTIIKSYPPKLKLDKRYYSIVADKDLRLEGYGSAPIVDDDTDVINLPPDWLVQKAITFLPINKISSNDLLATYRGAIALSAGEPINFPSPQSRKVVE